MLRGSAGELPVANPRDEPFGRQLRGSFGFLKCLAYPLFFCCSGVVHQLPEQTVRMRKVSTTSLSVISG